MGRERRALTTVGVLFAALTLLVVVHPAPNALDRAAGDALRVHGHWWLRTLVSTTTLFGQLPVVLALGALAAWWAWRRFRDARLAAFALLAPTAARAVELTMKLVIRRQLAPGFEGAHRESGYGLLARLVPPVKTMARYVYPSGHTTGATALAVVVVVLAGACGIRGRSRTALAVVAGAGAVWIGMTRLALGVHYVTDVVGGLLVGFLAAVGVWSALGRPTGHPAEPAAPARPDAVGLVASGAEGAGPGEDR